MFLQLGFSACSSDDSTEPPVASIQIATNDPTVNCQAAEEIISFTSSDAWTASSNVDWISLDKKSGTAGSATIKAQVAQNTTYDQRNGAITIKAGSVSKQLTITQEQKLMEQQVTGKWHLGWWISGGNEIHFDGTETISFTGNVMTWGGQQNPNGNGDYKLEYAKDFKSFVARKSGSETRFYIRHYTKDILVIQDNDATGAIRYWFTSAEAARAAQRSSLPEVEIDNSEIANPPHAEMNKIEDILAIKTGMTDSNITPMGRYFEGAHQTTEADIAWLLDPENEPDYAYANERPNAPSLTVWKKFEVNLYPFKSPEPADVNQHAIGDCSFCAVMASMAYLYPDYLKEIIKDNGNGTYTVQLYDPAGKAVKVCVKSTFLCDGNGTLAQVTGKNNEPTWSAVLEKAVMKYQTLYKIDSLWGIGSEHVAPILTGDGGSFSYGPNQLWNSELKLVADWSVDEGMLGVGGFTTPNLKCGSLYTVTAHAFTIMKTNYESDGYLFSMRNPWGIEKVDGVLDIPNTRLVCSTIDFRLINAGAAKPYLKKNRGAYVPPVWTRSAVDLGVSRSLLQMTDCQSIKPSPFYLRY